MSPSQSARTRRPANPTSPSSPSNTAWTGVVLVVVAVVVGIFLLAKGGGTAPIDVNAGRSPAAVANDKGASTTTAPPVVATPVGELKVVVSNGSGTSGRGNTVASQLISLGYTQANAKNGTKAANQKSAVYFVPGAEVDAKAVAVALNLAPTQVAALPPAIPLAKPAEIGASTVLVLVGTDFPGLAK